MIQYQLIYSARRKTLGLQVKQGQVIVRAPTFLSEHQIEQFIQSKSAWLKAKVRQTATPSAPTFNFENQQTLLICGKERAFYWRQSSVEQVKIEDDNLTISLAKPNSDAEKRRQQCRDMLNAWCQDYVLSNLEPLLSEKASTLGVNYNDIKVRRYKSRWGSCNSRGNLTFNSLLAMVPRSVFEYVVVHELSHLRYLDHSSKFWSLVESIKPNYQQDKAWLKQHQQTLSF